MRLQNEPGENIDPSEMRDPARLSALESLEFFVGLMLLGTRRPEAVRYVYSGFVDSRVDAPSRRAPRRTPRR